MSCGSCHGKEKHAGHDHPDYRLHLPFESATSILSSKAWPIPERGEVDTAVADGTLWTLSTPMFDFDPLSGLEVPSKKAAAVLGREVLVGGYWDVFPTTVTSCTARLTQLGVRLRGGQISIQNKATLEAYDVSPFLLNNSAFAFKFHVVQRFAAFRLAATAFGMTGTTGRLILWWAFDRAHIRQTPCPTCQIEGGRK